MDYKKLLELDPDQIDYSNQTMVKNDLTSVLSVCGYLIAKHRESQEEIQKLRDEINRLKNEKGKPKINPNKTKEVKDKDKNNSDGDKNNSDGDKNNSDGDKNNSDGDKNNDNNGSPNCGENNTEKIKKKRKRKKKNVPINSNVELKMSDEERCDLPVDAVFKGYRTVVIQEINLTTNNVEFKIPRYYSPSLQKTYEPQLPPEYQLGEYGPSLHAFVILLYFVGRVPIEKITYILKEIGIDISDSTVNDIIRKNETELTQERLEILKTIVSASTYLQTDDTGARVKGKNLYLNVYCNQFGTVFHTNPNKKRETINSFLDELGVDVSILLADDAPQFKKIAKILALCWVHEIRHYKKLIPSLVPEKKALETFLTDLRAYYKKLKNYKENPSEELKIKLAQDFDELFARETGYLLLNERIKLTARKKESLLVVLEHPEIPLHNNNSEQEIREPVIKRKVSNGTRSERGQKSWENNLSIYRTAKKLDLSFWTYIKNKFSKIKQLSLTEIIAQIADRSLVPT